MRSARRVLIRCGGVEVKVLDHGLQPGPRRRTDVGLGGGFGEQVLQGPRPSGVVVAGADGRIGGWGGPELLAHRAETVEGEGGVEHPFGFGGERVPVGVGDAGTLRRHAADSEHGEETGARKQVIA